MTLNQLSTRTSQSLQLVLIIISALLTLSFAGCGDEIPLRNTVNARVNYFVNSNSAVDELIKAIGRENTRVDAAFFTLENTQIADALIKAKQRGANVRVVGDDDNRNSSGFQKLIAAGIPCTFVDGELNYLPDPNLAQILSKTNGHIVRPGNLSDMSHNFVLLGSTDVWNFSAPFLQNYNPSIGYHATSELLSEDFTREFKQLFSRVSATNLDVYSGPNKSSVHKHPYESLDEVPFFYSDSLYSDQGRLRLLFTPQSGTVKTLIDEVYRAKGSVFIQSDSIEDPSLIKALKYKQSRGFPLKIVVNLTKQRNDLVNDLKALGARSVQTTYLPTVVIFDSEPGKGDNYLYPRQAMVMSHEILRASPLKITKSQPTDLIEQYRSDYYSDGHAWMANEVEGQRDKVEIITQLLDKFNKNYEGAPAL